ncbi:helix-turn-helix transcriptional regulator [Acinetobacter qingfengensis]|uniref:Transcriptional regulator n=1 Tax=Acinetobacter qingfengensis TaxID=1262585 RepID=A0A1E7REE2_9GAMM|nr:helix-turn-helix domain-containing protein [Acinetobacter qingfengensis]KAA8734781.1 helix-turn-helix transcriptional regulator [Acinetobacter qingfengensis]OEY97701.1 transcriptional regulator [Acinetobacter qingfengensis]
MNTDQHLKGRVLAQDCPSRQILLNLTSRWGGLVLISLRDCTLRFSELRQGIGGISEKMLAQTLKALEQDGFIHREVYPEVPPRVEYSLTAFGIEAAERFFHFTSWLEEMLPEILANRTQDL